MQKNQVQNNVVIIDFYRKKVHQSVSLDNQIFSDFFDEEGSWKKTRQPKDWGEDEQHLLDNTEFQNILQACLEALPDNWNTAVKLKYLLSKNGREICQEMGISQSNYWQIIHRAKLQLRDCIENNWFKD